MSSYVLSCCSVTDLDKEFFEKRDVKYVCFHFTLNGKSYTDDLGQSMPFDEFYKKITEKGSQVSTSQTSVGEYIEYFTGFLEKGLDILHICFSSGLSGAYNSALIAKKELEEKFPERKIYIVDSLGGSLGGGLLIDKAADLRDSGKSIDELYNWIEENKLKIHHWFFSTDLSFFVRGGRISKTAGLVGTILKICPVLNVNSEGKLIPRLKVRTKEKAIEEVVKKMEENADGGINYSERCFISHSDCYEDARKLADLIEDKFKNLKGRVRIGSIGTTIGCHTGPGTVALFFWGKKRTD